MAVASPSRLLLFHAACAFANSQTPAFRLIWFIIAIVILIYTRFAVANPLPHFFAPIATLTSQSQVCLDFASYLILSGIWMAWRGRLTAGNIALGILAPPFVIFFFTFQLTNLIGETSGVAQKFVLGTHAN